MTSELDEMIPICFPGSKAGSRGPDALGHSGAAGWKGPESLNHRHTWRSATCQPEQLNCIHYVSET